MEVLNTKKLKETVRTVCSKPSHQEGRPPTSKLIAFSTSQEVAERWKIEFTRYAEYALQIVNKAKKLSLSRSTGK